VATRAINDAIRANLTQKTVAAAGHRTLEIAKAIAYGTAISQQAIIFPHPEDSRSEFDSIVEGYLESGSFESIKRCMRILVIEETNRGRKMIY